MKTSQNIALRSAQFIRASVTDIREDAYPSSVIDNAIATLEEVATQLEQHAAGFEPSEPTTEDDLAKLLDEHQEASGHIALAVHFDYEDREAYERRDRIEAAILARLSRFTTAQELR